MPLLYWKRLTKRVFVLWLIVHALTAAGTRSGQALDGIDPLGPLTEPVRNGFALVGSGLILGFLAVLTVVVLDASARREVRFLATLGLTRWHLLAATAGLFLLFEAPLWLHAAYVR